MSMPVNADTFDKMVDEDIEWLKDNAPDNFVYREHIVSCKYWRKK